MFPLLTSPGPDLTRIAVSLQSSNRRVRPRLVWRNGTLLASPVVHGVTGHFSSCDSSVVLLTRYNGELREPLLWRQGSQVSMRVARRSASLLSSHGRGIAPQDALNKDSRGLLRVGAGNPWFPRLVPVISGRFKGASEKSGILCSWEGPLGTPLGSVQWKRASSRVEAGNSCFLS